MLLSNEYFIIMYSQSDYYQINAHRNKALYKSGKSQFLKVSPFRELSDGRTVIGASGKRFDIPIKMAIT